MSRGLSAKCRASKICVTIAPNYVILPHLTANFLGYILALFFTIWWSDPAQLVFQTKFLKFTFRSSWVTLPRQKAPSIPKSSPVFIFFGYVPLLESVYKSILYLASARAQTVLNIMYERGKKQKHLGHLI